MIKRRQNWSLRRRLLLWLMLPIILLCAIMLVESQISARLAADKAYDRLLHASALAIAERVVLVDGVVDVDLPYVALEMLSSAAQDRVFYKVTGPGGEFVTGYRDLPGIPEERQPSGRPGTLFFDTQYRNEQIRVAALYQPVAGGNVLVQVAHTRGERGLLVDEIALGSMRRLLLLALVSGVIIWFGIQRSLAPLALLRREIRNRSAQDLHPLEADTPREIGPLVTAINQLMERLGESLSAMQRFIANASHQLRTPLAALQTQAELALRADDIGALKFSLGQINDTTRHTSRLASQLLNHARISDSLSALNKTPLDLAELAASVTRELVPTALERDIDLGFETVQAPFVQGDALLLREVLTNLIDNAIRYCPGGSTITVRVVPGRQHTTRLEVEDNGPGIPLAERERVFERFYRAQGNDIDGCGLGLAIVKEIVQAHEGDIVLREGADGRGLRVQLDLPGVTGEA